MKVVTEDTNVFPLAAITHLIKNAGAEQVSEDACIPLRDALEAKAEKIAKKAISIANRAKRTTVEREDIEEAKTYLEDKRMVLGDLLEANAEEIAKRAVSLARHAGRETNQQFDVEEILYEIAEDEGEDMGMYLYKENRGEEIAKRAISLANHANRKIVKTEDIEEAINEVLGG